MDYVEKLGLHYCEDCGAISNLCFWDGEAIVDDETISFSGLAKIDDQAQTFELDHLLESNEKLEDCDSFGGEPNCPFCHSQDYWPISTKELIAKIEE